MNTREREKPWFKMFCEKCDIMPNNPKYEPGDSPDVIFEMEGKRIGIEITELYDDEKMRRQEAIKERICTEGQKLCENEKGMPKCHVGMWLGDRISKEREKNLSRELFEVVRNNIPIDGSVDVDEDILPSGVCYLSIYSYNNYPKRHFWTFAQVVEGGKIFSEQLCKRIKEKNDKYEKYCRSVDSCWLLITAVGKRGSSVFEFGSGMEEVEYKTPFERVFFLNGFNCQLNELKVIHRLCR